MTTSTPPLPGSPCPQPDRITGVTHVTVYEADYANPRHAAHVLLLLNAYAQDPAGGGEPLSAFAQSNLIAALAARPQAFSVLAYAVEEGTDAAAQDVPVGLINCIEGFSTFACRPWSMCMTWRCCRVTGGSAWRRACWRWPSRLPASAGRAS